MVCIEIEYECGVDISIGNIFDPPLSTLTPTKWGAQFERPKFTLQLQLNGADRAKKANVCIERSEMTSRTGCRMVQLLQPSSHRTAELGSKFEGFNFYVETTSRWWRREKTNLCFGRFWEVMGVLWFLGETPVRQLCLIWLISVMFVRLTHNRPLKYSKNELFSLKSPCFTHNTHRHVLQLHRIWRH